MVYHCQHKRCHSRLLKTTIQPTSLLGSDSNLTPYHHTLLVVSVDGHSLRVPAQLTIGCWTDRSAPCSCAAFLERKQLLSTECLVVDLGCGLDEVLKMCSGKEISKVDKFAVVLVLDIDDSPSVLTTANLLSSNND